MRYLDEQIAADLDRLTAAHAPRDLGLDQQIQTAAASRRIRQAIRDAEPRRRLNRRLASGELTHLLSDFIPRPEGTNTMALRSKPSAAETFTVIESFASSATGAIETYGEGRVLPGDHPAVRKHPRQFVPGGIPTDQVAARKRSLIADQEPA